jgi:hypothetical protein
MTTHDTTTIQRVMARSTLALGIVALQLGSALAVSGILALLSLTLPGLLPDFAVWTAFAAVALLGAWLPARCLAHAAARRYQTLRTLRPAWVASGSVAMMLVAATILIYTTPPQRAAVGRMLFLQVAVLPIASACGAMLGGLLSRRA